MENPSADVEMDQFETVSELPADENGAAKENVEKMETDENKAPKEGEVKKRAQAPPIVVKKELPVEDADWEIVSLKEGIFDSNNSRGSKTKLKSTKLKRKWSSLTSKKT